LPTPAQIAGGAPPGHGVDAGAAFAVALAAVLNAGLAATLVRRRLDPAVPLPPHLDAALVVESDAPCRFVLAELRVVYHRVVASFPGGEEKLVLRFSGERAESHDLAIDLPAGAVVLTASLAVDAQLRPDHPAAEDGGEPLAAPSETAGVHVDAECWAAQPLRPPRAVSASGVALAVMAMADEVELRVEVQADWQGRPSGRTLAAGAVALSAPGESAWSLVPFRESVVLPPQPHWLLATAVRGAAVWLARAGDGAVRLLAAGAPAGAGTEQSVLAGLEARHELVSRTETAAPRPQTGLAVGTVAVPTMAPPGGGERADAQRFDLTAALNAYLASHTAGAPVVSVPLTFRAIAAGRVTVYPPSVTYDAL
jgi:hypothetical protein